MTGIRGVGSNGRLLSVLGAAILLLAGCAAAGSQASPSPAQTPSAACPLVEGVELPPECAPYDPDQAMAQNDRYRDRMEITEEVRAAAEESIAGIRPALEDLRSSGDLSIEAVGAVMTDAGLSSPQLIGDRRGVAFGVGAPEGGCIFGQVSADDLVIEAGGYIMDGGCLPAQ